MTQRTSDPGTIDVIGAAENNLRTIDVSFPLGRLIVVTGPSGSGKTSLVHGVIGRVARRRWERMLGHQGALSSAYGPKVKELRGTPACIELKQEPLRGSMRSTIATYTGIAGALATVFSREGEQRGARGETLVESRDIDLISWARAHHKSSEPELFEITHLDDVVRARDLPDGNKVPLLFRESSRQWEKVSRSQLIQRLPSKGWLAVGCDAEGATGRLQADRLLRVGDVLVDPLFHVVSPSDPSPYWKPTPRLFSPFATAFGADVCPDCGGKGMIDSVHEAALIADENAPLLDGGLTLPMKDGRFLYLGVLDRIIRGFLRSRGLRTKASWKIMREQDRMELLRGSKSPVPEAMTDSDVMNKGKPFGGLINLVTSKAASAGAGAGVFAAMRQRNDCLVCAGSGLGPSARQVSWQGRRYHEILTQNVRDVLSWLSSLPPHAATSMVQVQRRLHWLNRFSLGYLALARHTATLSGGEGQRLRLSSAMIGRAQGMALILDEPCRGLHPSDTQGIIDVLHETVEAGNSLLVVEHNEALIRAADDIVMLGPGGGSHGGRIVEKLKEFRRHSTASPPSGAGKNKSKPTQTVITIEGLSINNVRNANLSLPTCALTVVVGPAGAGKSSAILKGLLPAVQAKLQGTKLPIYKRIGVPSGITFAEGVDQKLVAMNSRSTVATLLGLMDELRSHFGGSSEAISSGLTPSDFSFNNSDGACPACRGVGRMLTSDDDPTDELCHLCRGFRLKPEALAVTSSGKSVSDLLSLSIDDLTELDHPAFGRESRKTLASLVALGLGHLQLARSLDTLSGGERKRLGIARFQLQRVGERHSGLLVLDEPSSGLHTSDIAQLYGVLSAMAHEGRHTIVVIEHQAAAIEHADYIIDIGPAAGSEGGRILFSGDRIDFLKSDAPSAAAFESRPTARRRRQPRTEMGTDLLDSAPATGEGIALLADGGDLDHAWEHAARIRPVVQVGPRTANQDSRVWEFLDLAPAILSHAEHKPLNARVHPVSGESDLRCVLAAHDCAFSPVARQLRTYGPALIDLKPAVRSLLALGYTDGVIAGKRCPLKDLPKFVRNRDELRSCLVIHPSDRLIETSIRWSAGVISRLRENRVVVQVLTLRHLAEDGMIGAVFGDRHVADSRSPVGRCASCAGKGLVHTYDLSLIVRKMRASIADEKFLVSELGAALRGVMTREILPAARAFTDQGVVDLLTPPATLQRGDRLAFEFGIERRLLKASAKRTDREADWHRWRGLHDYVYQSWSRIPDDHRARLRASYREVVCPACAGTGLTWESKFVFVGPKSVREWWASGTVKELALTIAKHPALNRAVTAGLGDLRLGERLSELSDAHSTKIQLVSALAGPLRGVEILAPGGSGLTGLRRAYSLASMRLSSIEGVPSVA